MLIFHNRKRQTLLRACSSGGALLAVMVRSRRRGHSVELTVWGGGVAHSPMQTLPRSSYSVSGPNTAACWSVSVHRLPAVPGTQMGLLLPAVRRACTVYLLPISNPPTAPQPSVPRAPFSHQRAVCAAAGRSVCMQRLPARMQLFYIQPSLCTIFHYQSQMRT